MASLVYIAGYPRSGTTLLDRLLGASDRICGLGEAVLAFDYLFDSNARCTCGEPFATCSAWMPVRMRFPHLDEPARRAEYEACRARFETRLLSIVRARDDDPEAAAYRAAADAFWGSLEQAAGERSLLVDSSKSGADAMWRPVALSRMTGRDVRVLHLVRDVRGVMLSNRGSNMLIEQGKSGGAAKLWFTLLHWMYVNVVASLIRFFLPNGHYMLVRYEDLVNAPVEVIRDICRFLAISEDELPQRDESGGFRAGGHQVYGNRMRYQKSLVLKPDDAWRTSLPRFYRWVGAAAMGAWNLWGACSRLRRAKARA